MEHAWMYDPVTVPVTFLYLRCCDVASIAMSPRTLHLGICRLHPQELQIIHRIYADTSADDKLLITQINHENNELANDACFHPWSE
jgi:hypothetical protein